jgi:hypothetical protein
MRQIRFASLVAVVMGAGVLGASQASASVGGQNFSATFHSNLNGDYPAQMSFTSQGSAFVASGVLPNLYGTYSEEGTSFTVIDARLYSDTNYEALFYAISIDLKQSSIPLLQVLFSNTPATILGVGAGTDFEFFIFIGNENLSERAPHRSGRR